MNFPNWWDDINKIKRKCTGETKKQNLHVGPKTEIVTASIAMEVEAICATAMRVRPLKTHVCNPELEILIDDVPTH